MSLRLHQRSSGKNFDEIKRKVISHEIECPYFVSPEATHLLSKMLNRTVNERATLSEVANHGWLKHDGLPLYIMNSLLTYNFFLESTPRDLMKECLTEVGITEQQLKERMDRYDNVDGMHRLLLKDHRMRRLRKVWVDRKTTEIFVAAHILKSQGECMAVVPVVTKIAAAPIKEILQARAQEIDEAEENNATWSLYLPQPEEYSYHEFKEEQRKEAEENERMALESEQGSSTQFIPADYASVRTMEAAVGSSEASGRVQQPLTVAAHLQPPVVARSTKIADFIAAQNGSAMDASGNWEPSALLALAASLNEVPLELRRLPSDVCHRIAALDLIQKRRGGVPGQGPPLPKRQSLPSLFEQSILRRTTVRLGDPPKKNKRKNFFEMIRLKRRQADKQKGQSTSGTNWSLPPPALPEGGSFDDADEGKPAPDN
ncbi:hypothetical protein PRIPAC_96538 [Pristionchus pacificus]|uniref:Uncharacterized protein n=1 Tax=Pristionchus pacificus TaxID=54126 RepID=A0A2A6CUF1_PRIPA|nr:hypothetical protein PRIPAC_96538 [Pristionchus pacificus]|eukprot:PDM81852.1 hypothetical protein PRIPAC_34006 [Pristionchus pacificus]